MHSFFRFLKLQKRNILSGLIILASVLFSLFYIDAGHFRFPNKKINLAQNEITSYGNQIISKCTSIQSKDNPDCYKQELSLFTKMYGLSTGEALLTYMQNNEVYLRSCHVIAHYMAREAYTRSPWEFYSLVDTVNVGACGGGFLHGILETYIGKGKDGNHDTAIDNTLVTALCGRGTDEYRQLACVHLMGHMAILSSYGNVTEALPSCASLRENWQYLCYDGLFMEDHQKLMLSEHGITSPITLDEAYLKKMETACNTYTGLQGKACWKEISEMYAHKYGYDPTIIYNGCQKAPSKDYAEECYMKGVEVMATFPYNFETKEKLVPICSFYSDNSIKYNLCLNYILSAQLYTSFKFIPRGVTLCSNLETKYIGGCFNMFARILHKTSPDTTTLQKACANLPNEYRKMCTE